MRVNTKLKTTILLACLAMFLAAASAVTAQDLVVNQTEIRKQTKDFKDNAGLTFTDVQLGNALSDFDKLTTTEVCSQRQLNLAARIEFYRSNYQDFTQDYEQVQENGVAAVNRLSELEVDTERLNSLVSNLEDDIFAFKSEYFSLIEVLEANLEISCNDSFETENTLSEALDQLDQLRGAAVEIREQSLKVSSELQSLTPTSNE